ncbi:MAG TPA: GNAT family N-acetyltransferase [Candidatus Omnitrophota bacterium]|nr:GNAT family N-acetyltransferase [Candidatus Omnitrophota bacterium]
MSPHEVVLHTDRLILRQFRQNDFDAYAAMHADPDVMRYIGEGKPLSREEAWRSMAAMAGHWILRGYGIWAVEERATGILAGRVGLYYPEGWPGQEVGWTLARAFWGKGYAYEAARAAFAYAFETLRWPRIISLIDRENSRSIALAERLGERLEREVDLRGRPTLQYGIERPAGAGR